MLLQTWLADLQSPDTHKRLESALILGTLDEVTALEALSAQYPVETDPKVKGALAWAGKRLHTARRAGYSTLDAILQHFHIEDEIHPPQVDAEQQALMRKLQFEMEMDALRHQEAVAAQRAMNRIARGAMFGLPGLLMAATPDVTTLEVSRLDLAAPVRRRTPATRPADTDITMLLRRLSYESDWEKRIRAASDLAVIINNPQAIPHLARAFVQDRSPQVREAAQSAAKLLYWNHIYWHMEQDGSLAAEIARRSGRTPVAPLSAPPVAEAVVESWSPLREEADDVVEIREILEPPRRSLIHADPPADRESGAVRRAAAPADLPDDLLAAEYVEKPRRKLSQKSVEKPKQRSSGLMLLGLLAAIGVLICGGVFLIMAEGVRVVQEITTDPEFVNMMNTFSATPEGYGELPAGLPNRGTLEPFQAVQSTVDSGYDESWTFPGQAGADITLVTLVPEDGLNPYLFLYTPDGKLLAARADEFSAAIGIPLTTTLPAAGTYTVVVRAFMESNNYQLMLQYGSPLGD